MSASWMVFYLVLALGLASFADDLSIEVKKLLANKSYAQAEKLLTPKLESGNAETQMLLGDVYFAQSRWKDAVRLYSRAIELNSLMLAYYQKLADCYERLLDLQSQTTTVQKALKKFPKEKSLYSSLVLLLEKSGDDYEARAVQLDMIKKFGETKEANVNLCRLYAKESFFADSKKHCYRAIKRGSKDPGIYRYLSVALRGENKRPEGIKALSDGIAANPNAAVLFADLGSLYLEDKNWELASLNYHKASSLDAKNEDYALRLARANFELFHYDEVISSMRTCMKINPKKNAAEVRRFSGLLRAQSKLKEAERFDSLLTEFNY